ncbi:hypothetical protein LFYK43_05150 [Ligilactobacillus salitolerans]|uniref:Uncharacterized protein n=1 Tax=Ligilactobacillus salitolerans TaxID=1808352 RepID=A0A401IRA5_9LACO|nr:hypothetical protein [Ligilactobacillus salitolerans]GBG94056.1 hypothetical protein LFYK43_05150 [Ligilactobacillus salitolerans]
MSKLINIPLSGTTMKKAVKVANKIDKMQLNNNEFEEQTMDKLFSNSDLLDVLSALSKV